MGMKTCIIRNTIISLALVAAMVFLWAPEIAAAGTGSDTVETGSSAEAIDNSKVPSKHDKKYVEINPAFAQDGVLIQSPMDEADGQEARKGVMSLMSTSAKELPVQAKQLDNIYSRIIFNTARGGISFLLKDSGSSKYIVTFYNTKTGDYTTEFTSQNGQIPYYCQENQTIYFVGESHVSDGAGKYVYTPKVQTFNVETGVTDEFTLETFKLESNWANLISAVGVDANGRILISTNEETLFAYDSSGALLSNTAFEKDIDEFYGFDANSGNFYYQGTENWVYWGYDHYMASLMAGNVDTTGNVTLPEKNLMLLYQEYWFTHGEPCRLLNGRYLAALSTFNGGQMALLDSNQYDINDYTNQETTISFTDGGVGVSLLNIANKEAIRAQLTTAPANYPDNKNFDVASRGPQCALSEDGEILVAKTKADILTSYNLSTNKKLLQVQTEHEVYDLSMNGNSCTTVERDGDKLYFETIDWSVPTDFDVALQDSLTVGKTVQATPSVNSNLILSFTYESSDPRVCTVDARGEVSAWAEGDAEIIVTCTEMGKSRRVPVHVSGTDLSRNKEDYSVRNAQGTASDNIHLPYTSGYYGSVTQSYLARDGQDVIRVECFRDKVYVETYSNDYALKSRRTIPMELEDFGGFFSGTDAYYFVFGQSNFKESNDKEVIRVLKYDKGWNRTGACSIKGANTYIPFDAGGLSMCEANGNLYIHTCHEMYQSEDGLHHQANCDFKIKESNMTLVDSYTDVMNISEGYVSHSFQQKVCADKDMLYRADLGDMYPRGIALTGTLLKNKFDSPSIYGVVVPAPNSGWGNYTGFALGGLDVSENSYVVTGCGIAADYDETRNVFISASYKDDWKAGATWLTKYPEGSKTNVNTPKLVKLNNDQFMILWEEETGSKYKTKIALLGPDGSKASKIYSFDLPLSDCEPIIDSEGFVVWYVTDSSSPVFVRINPYRLAEAESHAAEDGPIVIIRDISMQEVELAAVNYTYTGKEIKPKIIAYGMKSGRDFTVTYKNNIKVGKGSVVLKGKGDYSGEMVLSFKINPKGTSVSSVKATKKGFTIKWKKQREQTDGYEIQYSKKKNFKSSTTIVIKKNSTGSKKIKRLKSKKKYYVRVRTFKMVNGQKFCSGWSSQKAVKTK